MEGRTPPNTQHTNLNVAHSSSDGSKSGVVWWHHVCWGRQASWGQSCCREGQLPSHFLPKRVGWRSNLPLSLLPRMHILEEHIHEEMGSGMWLVRGTRAESIHVYFNMLDYTYASIPDRLQWLKQKVVEHHLHTAPAYVSAHPTTSKWRKKDRSLVEESYDSYIET